MIIIEGPDNSGKSTLGVKLSLDLRIPLIHSEKPNPDWTPEQALEHATRQLKPRAVLLDRVYILSEYVYGPICRGRSALGELHPEALLDLYYRNYLIVYCRPSDKTILDNRGRDQMEGVLENHHKIIQEYDRLMTEIGIFGSNTVIHYNWEEIGSYPKVLHACRRHIKEFNSRYHSTVFMGITTC